MITKKDLEEKFLKETGMYAVSYGSQFTKWIEVKYLELLNELAVVDQMTADWVQACIEEEEIMAVNSLELNILTELPPNFMGTHKELLNELYKQNNE